MQDDADVTDYCLLLPHSINQWNEIRGILLNTRHHRSRVDVLWLILQLDYVENLAHMKSVTKRLFDLLPTRMTFVGLGTFLHRCLTAEERVHFHRELLPFVIERAVSIERWDTHSAPRICHQQRGMCEHCFCKYTTTTFQPTMPSFLGTLWFPSWLARSSVYYRITR